ncbi:GTPase Ypt3 [Pelomyxa schiedti]|nr:GTPase Ypt3 [Pelomyxa schiedti]
MTEEYSYLAKVLFVGEAAVGKTSLLRALTSGEPTPLQDYKATIGIDFATVTKPYPPHRDPIKFQLWDTSGQERFRTITTAYYRGARAIIICFDMTNMASFENLGRWMEEIESNTDHPVLLLCGLKSDLYELRVVARQDALDFAASFGASYIEVSSATMEGVDSIFDVLLHGQKSVEHRDVPVKNPSSRTFTAGDEGMPFTSITFSAQAIGRTVTVTSNHSFTNVHDDPMEVVFPFPTDIPAPVTSFDLTINGHTTHGVLKPLGAAQNTYEDAMAASRTVAMLHHTGKKRLALSLGILPAQGKAQVSFSWVTEMTYQGTSFKFVYPVSGSKTNSVTGKSGSGSGPFLEGSVSFQTDEVVSAVNCYTHTCNISHPTKGHTLLTVQRTPLPCPDVEVIFKVENPSINSQTAIVSVNELAVALSLLPSPSIDYRKLCFVALVDRSGSMSGSKWNQAQRALQLFLRSLPTNSFFNVVGFGSSFCSVFPEPRPYSQGTMENAAEVVSKWSASLGGTNMLAPLESIRDFKCGAGVRTVVVLLTDGIDETRTAVLNLAQLSRMRLYPLGIGADVDRDFLNSLASMTGGKSCFLPSGKNIEASVIDQLRLATGQKFEANISWGHLPSLCGPGSFVTSHKDPVTMVCGQSFTAYALCTVHPVPPPGTEIATAIITATICEKDVRWELPIRAPRTAYDGTTSPLHQLAGFFISLTQNNMAQTLGLQYQFMNQSVAFTAVDTHGTEALSTTPMLARINIAAPMLATSSLAHRTFSSSANCLDRLLQTGASSTDSCSDTIKISAPSSRPETAACGCGGGGEGRTHTPPPESRTRRTTTPTASASSSTASSSSSSSSTSSLPAPNVLLDALVQCQHADGYFKPDALRKSPVLAFLCKATISSGARPPGLSDELWFTCLVLNLFFTDHLESLRSEWALIANKAQEWVAANTGSKFSPEQCMALAKCFLMFLIQF